MAQRAYWPGQAPSPRTGTRVGATVEPFLIRTPEEVEAVWPEAEDILSADAIERLTLKEQRFLLAAFSRNSTLAYRCLRWARWMTPARTLAVSCLKCPCPKVWSDCVVMQRQRDGTSRIAGGKWRWFCPAYSEGSDPEPCGARFYDTSKTPFCGAQVSPGLVFAALAYPSEVIQRILKKGRRSTDASKVGSLVTNVQAMPDQTLHERLTQYARLFCGTVLLRDCPNLTRSFNGAQDMEARLRSLHGSGPIAKAYDGPAMRQRLESYVELRRLLADLEESDQRSPRDQTTQFQARREKRWQELHHAMQALCVPIEPRSMDLRALLDEAS